MKYFKRFEPNKKETFVCSECGHTFDLHVMSGIVRGCMTRYCRCNANGMFTRPVPPQIEERVTNNGKSELVNQPAPPTTGAI